MLAPTARDPDIARVRARIEGAVQGVGFRPHVYRLARSLGLAGFVLNDDRGVVAEVEGAAPAVRRFLDRVRADAPPLARVARITAENVRPIGAAGFAIVASERAPVAAVHVPADAATCPECLAELFDPGDRRFRYPFINCTDCGPRFTIVRGVPYDRRLTTMAGFAMCAACRAEYDDPASRRFHAQPNACPACGPMLRLVDGAGHSVGGEPLSVAVAALARGGIVALKSLGGFHLACRADDEDAVARLRLRKRRAEKPFAVMVATLGAAARLVHVDPVVREALGGRERPIVLAPRRADAPVAPGVAPHQADLGVMLPYSPLHHLLLADIGAPLVMTSGNVSDEPIAYRDDEAVRRLGGIADLLLLHDRPIATRTDDSVVRVMAVAGRRRVLPVRRSRGFVPLPVRLPVAAPEPILAVGGEMKCVCALARGGDAFLSQHLGDLGDERAYRAFVEAVIHLERLLDVEPAVVAHDFHPAYRSTAWAATLPDVARVAVQHHHAHVASCLADNGVDVPVIGVAWDGTGYGADGHVWGGEFLVADLGAFERVAHLEEVPLVGGDAAVREPWRMAAVFLRAAYGAAAMDVALARLPDLDRPAWRLLVGAAERGLNAPPTSSAGRLFDAVAALLGLRSRVSFEGQAAMELEALAAPEADAVYPVRLDDRIVHTTDVIRGVVDDLLADVPPPRIAARFHATLAEAIAAVCVGVRARTGLGRVALSGGVFQNAWLVRAATARLAATGFDVLCHRQVPPNDGGLALGQLAVAARWLAEAGPD